MTTSAQFGIVTGRVTRCLLIDPDAAQISLSKVMDWSWKEDTKRVESIGLDGVREVLVAFNGASGSFTAELKDMGLYDFFDARKAEYQATGAYRYSSLYGYLDYADGSEQVIHFKNVSLTMESGGEMKNEETVKLKVNFEAQDYEFL